MIPLPDISPALIAGACSTETRGRDLAVLIVLHETLTVGDWRVVRAWHIGRRIHMSERNVRRALSRLVAAGLLERQCPDPGCVYRLPERVTIAA